MSLSNEACERILQRVTRGYIFLFSRNVEGVYVNASFLITTGLKARMFAWLPWSRNMNLKSFLLRTQAGRLCKPLRFAVC